ncbi:hypothetical protein [Cytobacillus kochii]
MGKLIKTNFLLLLYFTYSVIPFYYSFPTLVSVYLGVVVSLFFLWLAINMDNILLKIKIIPVIMRTIYSIILKPYFLLGGLVILVNSIEKLVIRYESLDVVFSVGITILFLFILLYSLIDSLLKLPILLEITFQHKSSKWKFLNIFWLLLSLTSVIAIPLFIFGYIYYFMLTIFYNIDITLFECIYLCFTITYTLPIILDEESIINQSLKMINSTNFLRVFELVHILFMRAIELTLLSRIIGFINKYVHDLKIT